MFHSRLHFFSTSFISSFHCNLFPHSLYFFQVSSASSKTFFSQSSKGKNIDLGESQCFQTEKPFLVHDAKPSSTAKQELVIPCTLDLSKTQNDTSLATQSGSCSEQGEKLSLSKQSEDFSLAVSPDSQDSPDLLTIMSSDTSPMSGSPQLDQLLSDLKEMKHALRQETLDKPLSESSDDSPEVDKTFKSENLSPEDKDPLEHQDTLGASMSCTEQLEEDNENVTPTETQTSDSSLDYNKDRSVPSEFLSIPKSPQRFEEEMDPSLSQNAADAIETFPFVPDICEKKLCRENSTSDRSQEDRGSITQSNESEFVAEETSTDSVRDQHLCDGTSFEASSSHSLSDLTPETVTTARQFSFEELIPYPEISSDEEGTRTFEQHSEGSSPPFDYECVDSQSPSTQVKNEMASSTSDEEYTIPLEEAENSSDIYTQMPLGYTEVGHGSTDSPTFGYSDPEPYFDCKQGVSDFSETEPDEPETKATSAACQAQDQLSHVEIREKVLLSSGSEDYQDAPFIHDPLHHGNEENEQSQHFSDASNEEFIMCDDSQLPSTYDTKKSLRRVSQDLVKTCKFVPQS